MPATVLVVDDDELLQEVLEAYLTKEGYHVRLVANGESALEACRAQPPDIILLDARLGGMDGFTVCEHLKQDPTTFNIPVVLMTALVDDEVKQRGIRAGADDFIAKPFDALIMLNRIHTLLRYKRTFEALETILEQYAPQQATAILEELRNMRL